MNETRSLQLLFFTRPSHAQFHTWTKSPSQVLSKWQAAGETTNGWKYTFAGGRAGFDPGLRAALAKYESAAQISDQVIYPNTGVDDRGEPLTRTHKYVLHFDADKIPPVIVFWNMAMCA